jgi:hypothetical protein
MVTPLWLTKSLLPSLYKKESRASRDLEKRGRRDFGR